MSARTIENFVDNEFVGAAKTFDKINPVDGSLVATVSCVWTGDLRRGHRVGQAMDVGISWVNTWYLRDLRSPFGGSGLSGIGREGGVNSLHFYTEPTNVCIDLGAAS